MTGDGGSQLRRLLAEEAPVVAPGAFNALFARLIVEAGFPAVYLSGAGVANSLLGRPDLGIATMDEMVMVAERVCEVLDVPVIADGDTGYGGVHNVARTVSRYERVGVAAIQLEDQVFPKKCGHFEGKEVVSKREMLERIGAALDSRASQDSILVIARTDARGPIDLDEAIERARAYGEAGADVLFVEAPRSRDELERIGSELSDWPLMANMVEFGKTPLLPADELHTLGFSLIIYPGAVMRTITSSARQVLAELRSQGTTAGWLAHMASFDDVNQVVGLAEFNQWELDIASGAADRS
ncbi:MAG: isocitrate lyase/PEP mutase family protein [Acidimicrobiales bacterium]|nr:isocitrate lyase/PEP mutase family protein [Acidimicrobiales bacterium]